jgi:pyridoxal phosphate enzyme (YggS family)
MMEWGSMGIKERVDIVTASIAETAVRCGRSPGDITLCAVSKFHPLPAIEEAYKAGARVFGESRVQEFYTKLQGWDKARQDARIHMIGPLQRNKVKKVLELCSCIQSVDRDCLIDEIEKELEKTAATGKKQAILFEINSGEEAKSGYADKGAFFEGVEKALSCEHLRIEGLMTMAPFTDDDKIVRTAFRALYRLREEAETRYPPIDGKLNWKTLSMGMSGDYRIAIEEGSTMVRIGTAIFGEP